MTVGTTNRTLGEHHDTVRTVTWIAVTLVIIGALNWLLVGIFSWNLVSAIFGPMSVLSRIVYILVGLSGVYLAFFSPKMLGPGRTWERSDRPAT